ncbi:TRAP transporter small permease [Jannaschia sp. S6380]|uniref:TRAP transporter small permease n=1 Tax=Jannaschia sp. S6380 TaxID=2926408 RepID=UPI001FF3C2D6|nr:TRAP transporter small permease [Jannaschia sp. S6380]MCK0168205.1 TRAP transporter small permease [Jannaschia sp. S6380]
MLSRIIEALARVMAILGGLVLTALIVMTCLSVLGRFLNGWLHSAGLGGVAEATGIGPINGDFELVEAGMAFTIFAFLPITQLRDGHASVDIFTNALGVRANRVLAVLWSALFAAVMVLIAWQLGQGTQAKMAYGETTYLIQFPIWWAYAAALSGAVVAALVAVYVALVRIVELVTGAPILAPGGASH